MSLPSDKELTKQIRLMLVKAYDNGTVAEHSKRKIREMLIDHFGVDLEPIKKEIGKIILEQNDQEQESRAQASNSRSASISRSVSPVKATKAPKDTETTKATKAKISAKDQPAKKKTKKASGTRSKRKQLDSEDKDDNDGDDDDEKEYSIAPAAATSTTVSSDLSDADPSDDFSELDEDTSTSRVGRKKAAPTKAASSKKTSCSSTRRKSTASSTSAAGGSEAEQRLTRLKKLVSKCGVCKQWKKLYEAAGVSETDFRGQCNVVQGVLTDLGMTGKGSMEQARKIRDEREFADELAGLQENTVLDSGSRTRKARGSLTGKVTKPRTSITISDDDDDDDGDGESDFEQVAATKRSRSKRDDSDVGSEDDGPTRRKSFKSSLASFAAGLNSDSD
ncbi:uncharacterized protein SPSC_00257 [Sporisorium scitamineum]|uniref:DEK-C domain-containing protein n=1 Tax=Sporisorium scitamineum TaxID=49012 RepID=A0A140KM00_9BASI|nr:uncharacterized protein SPSC_00257 [Sporisorium scitamineum]